jgi:regulatory protein
MKFSKSNDFIDSDSTRNKDLKKGSIKTIRPLDPMDPLDPLDDLGHLGHLDDVEAGNSSEVFGAQNDQESQEFQGALRNLKSIRSLYAYGLGFLTGREASQKKLFQKLSERGEPELARQVLDRLITEGWVSDRRFAESYTNYRSERGFGPRYITSALCQEGLSRELIKEVFLSMDLDWEVLLQKLIDRKFPRILNKNMRNKAERFLISRGFDWEIVRKKLGKIDFKG